MSLKFPKKNLAIAVFIVLAQLCRNSEAITNSSTCNQSCVYDALSIFYNSTNGEQWKTSDGWLDRSLPAKKWFGISEFFDMKTSMTYYSIFLPNNGLNGTIPFGHNWTFPNLATLVVPNNPGIVGTIPDSISEYSFLKKINLRETNIIGSVPTGFFSLSHLEIADLKSLDMTGHNIVPEWGLMTSLKELHLQGTNVIGGLPVELFNLLNLEELNLSNNPNIEGTLPSEIGNLKQLKVARLDRTGLAGIIPSVFFELPALEKINLSRNKNLLGSIPDTINRLNMLREFNIEYCSLTGTLPAFSGSKNLTSLKLSYNNFTGSIPGNFLNITSTTTEPVIVDLDSNYLSGLIPQNLDRFSFLDINLANNLITDLPSTLCANEGWIGGMVATFGCDSILCPPGTYNSEGRQVSNETPCEICESSCYFGAIGLSCDAKDEPCQTNSPTIPPTMVPIETYPPTVLPTFLVTSPKPSSFPSIVLTNLPTSLRASNSPSVDADDGSIASFLPTFMPSTVSNNPQTESPTTTPTKLPSITIVGTVIPTEAPTTLGSIDTNFFSEENDSSGFVENSYVLFTPIVVVAVLFF